MFSVKVENKKVSGIYEARSVAVKNYDGNQVVDIMNEANDHTQIEIEGAAEVWVMNNIGKTVAHYHIDGSSATIVNEKIS